MVDVQQKDETYNVLSILGKPDDRGDNRRHVDIACLIRFGASATVLVMRQNPCGDGDYRQPVW